MATLMVISARGLTGGRPLAGVLAAAGRGGPELVQLREKDLAGRDFYELALAVRAALPPEVRLVVNDRADVALAAGADGVHLGGGSLPVATARRLLGPEGLVGASVHSLDAARRAAGEGADYLLFGHVFATGSKPDLAPRGLEALAAVVEGVSIPVLALGGISSANASLCLRAGAAGVAAMSAVMAAADPEAAVRQLKQVMGRGYGGGG